MQQGVRDNLTSKHIAHTDEHGLNSIDPDKLSE